jgi:uncharacterized membrane protein YfcA
MTRKRKSKHLWLAGLAAGLTTIGLIFLFIVFADSSGEGAEWAAIIILYFAITLIPLTGFFCYVSTNPKYAARGWSALKRCLLAGAVIGLLVGITLAGADPNYKFETIFTYLLMGLSTGLFFRAYLLPLRGKPTGV